MVVVGIALDYCVKDTARDGATLGYPTTVIEAATAAVNLTEGDDDRARESIAAAGGRIV